MKKIVTLGEIMLRLSPPRFQIIEHAHNFNAVYGGGEANVAISLSRLGLRSSFISKLPKNPLGVSAEQYLNRFGVTTEHMLYGGDRLGIYFLEKGFSIRSSKVFYDRRHSAITTARLEEFDFDTIFADADWFHVSGITPALNEELFLITKTALMKAKENGLTTSCDLNYRSALWPFDVARKKMTELIEYVDVCIGVEPLELLDENGNEIKDRLPKPAKLEDYQDIIRQIQKRYNIQYLAMTHRNVLSVNRNRLSAMLSDGTNFYKSDEVEVEIVDRVGAGDAFSAGVIYSLIAGMEPQNAIEFATGCFALKHTIEGDVNLLEVSDIENFINNKNALSIKR